MPNKAAAKKYLRKSKKRQIKNRALKNNLKKVIKNTRKLIAAQKSPEKTKEMLAKAVKSLDKAAKARVIKKNTRDRKKSRLTRAYNKIK